ncbi:MAG: hypothetical protein AAFY56_21020 [Pseudomonadota bacterium]
MTTTAKRRQVLLSLGAGSVAMAAGVSACTAADPHRVWLQECVDMESLPIYTDQDCNRRFELIQRIWRTPAATVDGIRAQIELLLYQEVSDFVGQPELDGYRNILASLDTLGAVQ